VSSSGRNGSAWRHVAPAGAPIRALDLIRAAGLALRGSEAGRALQREIARRFGVRHTFLTSTGRAGMTLLMRALGRAAAKPNPKDEVLVPAYTCYSVAASIVKAGLRPRLVDISPETLDFDREQLSSIDCSKVLAIVATVIILKVVDALVGLRVSAEDEVAGLDLSQHSETAYSSGGGYGEIGVPNSGVAEAVSRPRVAH